MAVSLPLLIQRVYKVCASVIKMAQVTEKMIEDRKVNQQPFQYQIRYSLTPNRTQSFVDGDKIWKPIKINTREETNTQVYNLEVEDDNSYVANGAVVHNCQSFSKAGKQLGYEDPDRGNLFEVSCSIIAAKKPPFILAENVENFMAHDDLKTPLTALQMLSDMGYLVDFHLVGGTDFGMPQIRKRVYIFGVREDSVHLLKTNIREAIDGFRREIEKANYEVLSTDKTNTDSSTSQYERYLAHKSSLDSFRRQEVISQQGNKALQDSKQCYSSPENYKSLKNINEGRESETINVIPYSNTTKGEEKTFRIRLDDVANTFLAHGSFCCAENGGTLVQDHGELRYFSPEEAETLMGWPKETTKYGIYNGKVQEVPLTKRYFMIGNGIISNCSKDIINSVL